jgi:hypothetical protein
MPKRKGLGKEVAKSIETMDKLLSCLRDFSKAPVKKGLQINKASDDKAVKMVSDAKEKAFALSQTVEDLRDLLKGIKTNKNSRFAHRVVRNFLHESL